MTPINLEEVIARAIVKYLMDAGHPINLGMLSDAVRRCADDVHRCAEDVANDSVPLIRLGQGSYVKDYMMEAQDETRPQSSSDA